MKTTGTFVTLFGALFGALGLGFWLAPAETAHLLLLDAIGPAGLAAARSDLAGLFLGLAAISLTSVATRNRSLSVAAAAVLAAVVLTRLIGLIGSAGPAGQASLLAIEVAAMVALVLLARSLHASPPPPAKPAWSGRKLLAVGILLVAAVGAAAMLLNPRVELAIFERAARDVTARNNSYLLGDDALRVAICGSSAPLPSDTRAKSCIAVFAGGRFYIVDVGPESVENLTQWGIPLSRIGGVLLTHFHSDHIGDLGELNLQTWAGGRPAPLDVYGGPGIEQVVDGFNRAYRLDQRYRTTHHTDAVMPAATWPMTPHRVELVGPETPAKDRSARVLDQGGLRITAIEVDHAPITPAYAYRFDYNGRSVVVTGDLKYHAPMTVAAKGADVLVSEAIARPMVQALRDGSAAAGRERQATIMHDIQDYHISPVEAAQIANEAGVKLLVFYHLLPAPDTLLTRRLFAHDVGQVRRQGWTLADDNNLYTLPVDSDAIVAGRIER
jgi:ribonuclease Z